MQRKKVAAAVDRPPHFKNEAEEADWLASPAGRRFSARKMAEARQRGTIKIEGRTDKDFRLGMKLAKGTGKSVKFVNGLDIERTDPEKLKVLVDRAKAKATEQIALRLPVADLDAVKRLAAKHGVGYQTLLKEIIHDALGRAS